MNGVREIVGLFLRKDSLWMMPSESFWFFEWWPEG